MARSSRAALAAVLAAAVGCTGGAATGTSTGEAPLDPVPHTTTVRSVEGGGNLIEVAPRRFAVPAAGVRLGPEHAPVTVITFATATGARSERVLRSLANLIDQSETAVRVFVRYLPDDAGAAPALLCAGDQGQAEHWELQQRLWLSSRGGAVLDPAALEAALADSGLAEACGPEVRAALASRLDNNREVALRFALPGAPFSFINGDPLYDEAEPAVLVGAAQEALAPARALLEDQVPLEDLYPTLIASGFTGPPPI
jgi:hypothetical protein